MSAPMTAPSVREALEITAGILNLSTARRGG